MGDVSTQWIDHKYLETYRIASYVQAFSRNSINHLRELEGLTVDFGIAEFIPHWQKDTSLHKFTRYVIDIIFANDNDGSHRVPFGDDLVHPKWTVPVEMAFVTYGIRDEIEFEVPKIPPIPVREGNVTSYHDATEMLNRCWEHFEETRLSQDYEDLLHRVADEVFFVMFTNRATLQQLHRYLSGHVVSDYDADYIRTEFPEIQRYYTESGRLRRTVIPKWARRAIFFRDRGICTTCRKDLSGLLNTMSRENFDHIVPLARGGLNDVTNLQLLCESCNKSKSAIEQPTSTHYQRWFT